MEGAALRMIHHSTNDLDALVDGIVSELRPTAAATPSQAEQPLTKPAIKKFIAQV